MAIIIKLDVHSRDNHHVYNGSFFGINHIIQLVYKIIMRMIILLLLLLWLILSNILFLNVCKVPPSLFCVPLVSRRPFFCRGKIILHRDVLLLYYLLLKADYYLQIHLTIHRFIVFIIYNFINIIFIHHFFVWLDLTASIIISYNRYHVTVKLGYFYL